MRLFVSYAHDDMPVCKEIVKRLNRAHEVWHDDRLFAGQNWWEVIQEQLKRSEGFIFLLSPASVASEYCQKELALAKEMNKHIFPILIRKVTEIPDNIAEIQYVDLSWDMENIIEVLNAVTVAERKQSANQKVLSTPHDVSSSLVKSDYAVLAANDAIQTLSILKSFDEYPPVSLWSRMMGRVDYWRARHLRQWYRHDHYPGIVVGQDFQDTLSTNKQDFVIGFGEWGARKEHISLEYLVTIIIGPAGVGKTRFVNKVFKELLEWPELIVELQASHLEAFSNGKEGTLWQHILKYVEKDKKAGMRGLTPAAVDYALRNRRCLFIIEDLHVADSINNLIQLLRNYFETYHTWDTHLRFLLTTREALDSNSHGLGPDVQVISLKPLDNDKYEPQKFFLSLCENNGLEVEVSAIGEALANAFSTETTRTPLFIVMCAFLAVRDETSDIAQVLQMENVRVIDRFIRELYRRSDPDSRPDWDIFLQAYAVIAKEVWPKWQELAYDEVSEVLASMVDHADSGPLIEFLRINSFLSRSQEYFNVEHYSFPHQSIADYLTAKMMVSMRDFKALHDHFSFTRITGLIEFIAELITDDLRLVALANHEIEAFTYVVQNRPEIIQRQTQDERQDLIRQIVDAIVIWVTTHSKRSISVDTWRTLVGLLSKRYPWWVDHLNAALTKIVPETRVFELVALAGGEKNLSLFQQWLADDNGSLFKEAARTPEVRQVLKQIMQTDSDTAVSVRWHAFKVACLTHDDDLLEAAEAYCKRNAPFWDEERLRSAIREGQTALKMLVEAFREARIERRQGISALVTEELGDVLVFPGSYSIRNEEQKSVTVNVNRAFLVPRKSKEIRREFVDIRSVENAIREVANFNNLMSKPQAFVTYYYYGDTITRSGATFAPADDFYPEAFRVSRNGIALFSVTDSSKSQIQVVPDSTPTSQPTARKLRRIAYREIKFL